MNNLSLQKQYSYDSIKTNHECVFYDYSKDYEKCYICGNLKKKDNNKPAWMKGFSNEMHQKWKNRTD